MQDEQTFRRIIVGCDGEPSGQDALALGGVLAGISQSDLIAVGVYPDARLPFPSDSEWRSECEQLLRADRDAFAPNARIRAIPSMSPASALRHAVEYERADLLVLGSDRHTEAGRVRPGRHARQLLHGAPSAVALAPRGYADHPAELHRIVVGFDGSEESADALAHARRIAGAAGARLRVITAVNPMPPTTGGFEAMVYLPGDWERMADLERRHARERLDEELGNDPGIDAEIAETDPGIALCEASTDADLLVIGSRHWGPFARLVLGSAAEYVVRHAHCPVLVMPRITSEAAKAKHEETVAAP